ncbi:MAG TPA: transposase, partial [Micromonosporaceae bacterium]|nr:transposase [Micromonosporaceae bacterium]
MRVYCGLASANQDARLATAEATLVAAVVDDAGRLLNVCEIADAPAGYARLAQMLVERSSGPSGAAVAADRADHVVTSLLTAAGSPLAIVEEGTIDDYAERFADDDSMEEVHSPSTVRRAVGLARALQAGAICAVTLPTPPDLAAHKPVLNAHAALAHGRRAAAVALREVLRELYPAALRAYPDPADPVTLAVLDALPEPSMLTATGRGRTAALEADAVVAHLSSDRIADEETVAAAVTALRVAVSETPRRNPTSRGVTSAVADAVRQAVAAVRACDAGCEALVATLAQRRPQTTVETPERTGRRGAEGSVAQPAEPAPRTVRRAAVAEPEPSRSATSQPAADRRARSQPAALNGSPVTPRPLTAPPVAPQPLAPQPLAPQPVTQQPVTAPPPTRRRYNAPVSALPANAPVTAPPANAPVTAPPVITSAAWEAGATLPEPESPTAPAAYRAGPAIRPVSPAARAGQRSQPVARPVSAPPPPPGITPIVPSQRGRRSAESGESFPPSSAPAATNRSRAERTRPTPIAPRRRGGAEPAASSGFSATDYSIPVPTPRPAAEAPAPGSRGNWPLVNSSDDRDSGPRFPYDEAAGPNFGFPAEPPAGARVKPPWLADDLPPEPPMLRLVEPPPLADRALRDESRGRSDDLSAESAPVRVADVDRFADAGRADWSSRDSADRVPPVPDEGDGDLLIFAQIRSAWFSGDAEGSDADWSSLTDPGWLAAEQVA